MTLIRTSPSLGVGTGRWIKAIGLPTSSTARAFMLAISVVNWGEIGRLLRWRKKKHG